MPNEPMVACIEVESRDLKLFGYVMNAGILRIREQCTFKRLDVWDKDAIEFAEEILKQLCREYVRISPKEKKREPSSD